MKDVLWDSLVSSLQSGKCVLVLGSDIPVVPRGSEAGAVTEIKSVRDAFCQRLAAQLEEENYKVGELVLFSVAQQFEDSSALSTVNLKNIAAQFFRNPGYGPGPLHEKLARFPFSLVLTTCHDDLFGGALRLQGKVPSRIWYHYRGEPRDNREVAGRPSPVSPTVYQLFGAYDEPTSLVLTENDLLDFITHVISGNPGLPNSLKSLLRNNTFLFVGFGIRHWYIRVLLKLLIRTLELSAGSVALESLDELDPLEIAQTVLFYQRGGTRVEVVNMEALTFIQELTDRFDRVGGYLGTVQNRIRRVQVFVSYEHSDEGIAKRLYDALPKDQFDPWLDKSLLEGGVDWNLEIEEKIRASDFFLVLNSKYLVEKRVGYVNKELSLALDLQKYRQHGTKFIIPILVDGITVEEGRSDLRSFQQLPLRSTAFHDDVAQIRSTMFRDFQLRTR